MTPSHRAIDWSQLWYPGRKQPFTAAEMASAGSDAPSPTLAAVAVLNFATVAFVTLQIAPPAQTAQLTGGLVLLALLTWTSVRWLWWRPWRRPLMQAQVASAAVLVALAFALRWQLPDHTDRAVVSLVLALGTALLIAVQWFLVTWRAGQIDARLREQAEREHAIEMARRLAAAQMEPHFLFNTLASVQHWVQTQDARAGPLLAALTGYLRATLPLFNRPLLAVGDELPAIERYLEVMQARLGPRLHWTITIDPALHSLLLPSGVLLTLVENAVMHGVEPQLSGGALHLNGRRAGDQALLEVIDNGPGPPPTLHEGLGLSNIRQRLALTCGPAAELRLGAAPGGGFRAQLTVPFVPTTP